MRRGIDTRIITVGYGRHDGHEQFPDITFKSIHSKEQLSLLNDTLVYVTYPLAVRTKRPAYAILHCPPASCGQPDPLFNRKAALAKNIRLIAASRFSATMWERDLGLTRGSIAVDYPFADNAFRAVQRTKHRHGPMRLLFSGRLHPDKGVYTLLASLHILNKGRTPLELTVTTAGAHSDDGQVIKAILDAHPWVRVVPAGRSAEDVASLMANHDIVIMPSTDIFWKELFGMVSVEAQHAGCRVIASNAGGLPETDCGGLMLVQPDNPQALAEGIQLAAKRGPLSTLERRRAANVFTVEESVEVLLDILAEPEPVTAPYRLPLPGTTTAAKLAGGIKPSLPRSASLLRSDYMTDLP
jgi:glycosyltransferase involved in cell wall biosynthesis